MTTPCRLTGLLIGPDGEALPNQAFAFYPLGGISGVEAGVVVPNVKAGVSGEDASLPDSLELYPGPYELRIKTSRATHVTTVQVPEAASVALADLLPSVAEPVVAAWLVKGRAWADAAEDVEVEAGAFSAKHWSEKARKTAETLDDLTSLENLVASGEASASSADASAQAAAASQIDAAQSATDAEAARDLARRWAESETAPDAPGTKSAKTWAGEAAASEAAAADDADASASSASASADSAAAALVSRALALAAANASGPAVVFETKAAANTALSGLADGTVVEVSIDESRAARRTRYRVASAAYVFELDLSGRRRIHLDPINGDDGNAGLTPDLPVASVAAAAAALQDGDELYVARNSLIYRGNFSGKKHIKVRPFGSGRRPIFTAAKPILSEWAAVDGYTGVYKATVVHDVATEASNDPAFYCQFAVWDDARDSFLPARIAGLRRFADDPSGGVALADELALLTPGSFTVRRTGADDASPYNVSATSFDYYVRLKDDADPDTLTDRTIRYAEQTTTAGFGFGSDIEGVDFCRSASKDHVSGGTGSGSVGRIHDVRVIDASVHGSVMRASTYTKHYAEKNPYASFGGAGNGLHLYRSEGTDGISRGAWCDDIEIVGFATGLFAHGDGGEPGSSTKAFDTWEMGHIKVRDCGMAFQVNEVEAVTHVKSLHISGSAGNGNPEGTRGLAGGAGGVIVDDFSFCADSEVAGAIQVFAGGNIHIRNGWSYVPPEPSGSATIRALIGGSTSDPDTIRLENFTNLRGDWATTFGAATTLISTNSVLGDLGSKMLTTSGDVIATNCQIASGALTLAELQAVHPGIADDCIVPFYLQPYEHTYAAGEITTQAMSGAAAINIDITAGAGFFLSARSNHHTSNYSFLITGAGVAGADLLVQQVARDPTNDAGGKFAYTCPHIASYPTTVANVGAKEFYAAGPIFPMTGTARLCQDQDHLIVEDASVFSPGQLVRIGGVGNFNGGDPFGLFKVASIPAAGPNGDRIQLTEAVPWRSFTGSGRISYRSSDGTGGQLGPEVALSFGFPIWVQVGSSVIAGVEGTLTYVETGGEVDFDTLVSGELGRFNPTTVQFGSARVENETGVIPNTLRVSAGDSVSLTARILVDEYVPRFEGQPELSRIPILARKSVLALRGMGWRHLTPFGGVDGRYTDLD